MRSLVLSLAVLSADCSPPSPPTITPEKVSVTHLDVTGISLDFTMRVSNPNSFDLVANDVTSHLVVEKTHDVGTVTFPRKLTFPGKATTEVEVPVTLKWVDMGVVASLATANGAVPYSVDGTLEMGGTLLHVGVPFHFDGTITREQIVGAVLNSIPFPQ